MQVFTRSAYGPPDHLRREERPLPEPGPGEVLVEVGAVSINGSDWEILVGSPGYARLFGLRRPRPAARVLGSDIAGVVAGVGPGVTGVAPGDRVILDNFERFGGFADYALAEARRLVPMPDGLSFEEAAVLPQSAAIAVAGTAEQGIAAGQRVLINGASGGGGTIAVQIAVWFGAEVTAVDRGDRLEGLADLGATRCLDYRKTDFARDDARYDLVLDLFGTRKAQDVAQALAPGGRYLLVGGTMAALASVALNGMLPRRFGDRRVGVLRVAQTPEALRRALDLMQRGAFRPVIDRVFPLAETPAALGWHAEGRKLGKVVVSRGLTP